MTFSGRCWRRRLVALATGSSLPSACGVAGSIQAAAAVRPPVLDYRGDLLFEAPAEIELLPAGMAVEAPQRLCRDARSGSGLQQSLILIHLFRQVGALQRVRGTSCRRQHP
jgi:hypothetical protein